MDRNGASFVEKGYLEAGMDELHSNPSTNNSAPLLPRGHPYDMESWSFSPLSQVPNIDTPWNDFHLFTTLDFTLSPALTGTQPTSAKPRKKRGKTYIGCFTCKQRKIKCDERRPVCRNCERSRTYSCQGYLDDGVVATNGADEHMYAPGENAHKRSRPPNEEQPEFRHHEPTQRPLSNFPTASSDEGLDQVNPTAGVGLENLTTGSHLDDIVRHHADGETPAASIESAIEDEDEDSDLLEHYRDVVCHIMMPTIDASRNPWLQLYLPLALKSPPTTTQLALRHALLSVSAHHRTQSNISTRSSDRMRAESHKIKASQLLRELTNSYADTSDVTEKCSLLAAAMTLITVGVFSGDQGDCHTDLELAKLILLKTGGERFWKSHLQPSILLQIFRCYDTVASTMKVQTVGLWDDPGGPDESDSPQSPDEQMTFFPSAVQQRRQSAMEPGSTMQEFPYTEHYILDISFGIGLGTISVLNKIIQLARACSAYDDPSSWPRSLADTIDALETHLYATEANPTAFKRTARDDPAPFKIASKSFKARQPSTTLPRIVSDELIENHQWAFHYAVIIFFHRAIRPLSSKLRASRIKTPQRCVGKVFDRLENIDCLTRGTSVRPADTLWPAFIAACEAVEIPLRHRALIWFAKAGKRGIGNIAAAKELVMEVWRRVDRMVDDEGNDGALGPVDWRRVMEDMEWKIMLT